MGLLGGHLILIFGFNGQKTLGSFFKKTFYNKSKYEIITMRRWIIVPDTVGAKNYQYFTPFVLSLIDSPNRYNVTKYKRILE